MSRAGQRVEHAAESAGARARSILGLGLVATIALFSASLPAGAQQPAPQGQGRISGTVRDATSGRPLAVASVQVLDVTPAVGVLTDVEGRFRTGLVPAGLHAVAVSMIGFSQTRIDSVSVAAGGVARLEIVLSPEALQLEGITATATAARASTASGLLAVQKNAPVVMDGISAEQMSRSPDSDAADAMTRVTGVSVVDDKFVVVRGLTERYSNTLLNGVELASPEPTRRVVPLDLFPAALLQSVVSVKTATPDIPGDFAGGSVDIETKDFPDSRVFEVKVSGSSNSESTFKTLPIFSRNGLSDMTGFDGADRSRRPTSDLTERFRPGVATALAKTLRTVWTPTPRQVPPNLGLSLQYGDQLGAFERALGFIFSFDYGLDTGYEPGEYFAVLNADGSPQIETLTEHATTTADWGLLANGALRLGPSHTLGFKNLITQESEEFTVIHQAAYNQGAEYNFGPLIHRYQVRYIERGFVQSQLRGQHNFSWSNWEWTLTGSRAKRDEPENRSLTYLNDAGTYRLDSWKPNKYWFRFLEDQTRSANLDVSIPLGRWFGDAEGMLKFGGSGRLKHRDFDGYKFTVVPASDDLPDGQDALALPPDQVVAPENFGRNLRAEPGLPDGLPYRSDDDLMAAYLMGDLPLPLGLRMVGGVRAERWSLHMLNLQPPPGLDSVAKREILDILPSLNVIVGLSDRMNLRAAGYITVSRPDPREIALGDYAPVAGNCVQTGNPQLKRAMITNADLRWEWYPGGGEVISLSGFYKIFDDAIVEYVSLNNNDCQTSPQNARWAYSAGAEFELRKNLGFLSSALSNVMVGGNFTYATGAADLILGATINQRLDMQDLSKYVANANLVYNEPLSGVSASVLYTYFGDRISLYGDFNGNGGKTPDIVEHGRGTIDFKLSKRFRGVSASLSGKNLTNEVGWETQMTTSGPTLVGLRRIGRSLSLSVGYAF